MNRYVCSDVSAFFRYNFIKHLPIENKADLVRFMIKHYSGVIDPNTELKEPEWPAVIRRFFNVLNSRNGRFFPGGKKFGEWKVSYHAKKMRQLKLFNVKPWVDHIQAVCCDTDDLSKNIIAMLAMIFLNENVFRCHGVFWPRTIGSMTPGSATFNLAHDDLYAGLEIRSKQPLLNVVWNSTWGKNGHTLQATLVEKFSTMQTDYCPMRKKQYHYQYRYRFFPEDQGEFFLGTGHVRINGWHIINGWEKLEAYLVIDKYLYLARRFYDFLNYYNNTTFLYPTNLKETTWFTSGNVVRPSLSFDLVDGKFGIHSAAERNNEIDWYNLDDFWADRLKRVAEGEEGGAGHWLD